MIAMHNQSEECDPSDARATAPQDDTAPQESAAQALLVSALERLAARIQHEAADELGDEAYDERDYHALAQGFHAARRDMLDAESAPAVVHRFQASQRRTAYASRKRSMLVAVAAMAAGLLLIVWTMMGNRGATSSGADLDDLRVGTVRGSGARLDLQCERREQSLSFRWTGSELGSAPRYTLRIYPAGSLRAALTIEGHLTNELEIPRSQLEAGVAYEAEVELVTALTSGVAVTSTRVPFEF